MAVTLKLPIRFPIFAPFIDPNPNPTHQRPSTEIRFSRWNNANAEKFNQRRRAQQEIEDEIRRTRRFDSADIIANIAAATTAAAAAAVETFKSVGTPSAPSRPSIPGKKSKYSKPPPKPHSFRLSKNPNPGAQFQPAPAAKVKIGDDGVSYVVDGAPFEFRYSYTETPAAKPIKMREPPFVPFGPANIRRPWTGRAPPPSRKKFNKFDSNGSTSNPIQSSGPFSEGSSPVQPVHFHSREEILGEPLTQDEINVLVNGTMKTTRQLIIGRDGLIHNMLDTIHTYWKRRKVCKIKCIGVCTLDMDNVCQQLEERTGGKIIYRKGGAVYLFRGRNYNYETRPRFPFMLWKPAAPVYPKLIKRVPKGLTLQKATEMRQKGNDLIPVCKLAKNGSYCDLVTNVREAFEVCELVRLNCQGLNASDYKRIGAKLKDLVPCILLSFENEHILMWRGQNWRPSSSNLRDDSKEANKINVDSENSNALPSDAQELSVPCLQKNSVEHLSNEPHDTRISSSSGDVSLRKVKVPYPTENSNLLVSVVTDPASLPMKTYGVESTEDVMGSSGEPQPCGSTSSSVTMLGTGDNSINGMVDPHNHKLLDSVGVADVRRSRSAACTEEVLLLLDQAVKKGSALVLDDESLDADHIYQATVALAKSAPPEPVFKPPERLWVRKSDKQECLTLQTKEVTTVMMNGKKVGVEF